MIRDQVGKTQYGGESYIVLFQPANSMFAEGVRKIIFSFLLSGEAQKNNNSGIVSLLLLG